MSGAEPFFLRALSRFLAALHFTALDTTKKLPNCLAFYDLLDVLLFLLLPPVGEQGVVLVLVPGQQQVTAGTACLLVEEELTAR